jgi:excisionase family DNA binding protein
MMDKKLTVIEAAKLLGVSKEAIYNRLRRGTLQSVMENGTKYIILTKNSVQNPTVRKVESSFDSAYIELLKLQLEEVKLKNAQLEADKERLISDKEKLLIESKEKIEAIYKEKDEQLKTILSLANRQITVNNPDIDTPPMRQTPKETFFEENYEFVDEPLFEEADVLEEEAKNEVVETMFGSYNDWRDLRSYLKEKGFSKKEKQNISNKLGKKVGHDGDVMDKNGKIFIKKGKKLKEILGS